MHILKYREGDLVKIVHDKIDHEIPIGTICRIEHATHESRYGLYSRNWQEYRVSYTPKGGDDIRYRWRKKS